VENLKYLKLIYLPLFSAILGILAFLPFKNFYIFGFFFLVPFLFFLLKRADFGSWFRALLFLD
jgi:hypothetical protein